MILRETYRQKMKERIDSMTHREERESAIWSALPIKRITACMLITAMVFPFTACKKNTEKDPILGHPKYTSGQEIKETDTYFDAEVNPLQLPVDKDKKLDYLYVENCDFVGNLVIASYFINYEMPEDVRMEDLSYEEGLEYYKCGMALFDEKGKLILELKGDGFQLYDAACDKDGNICMLYDFFNVEEGDTGLQVQVYGRDGEEKNRITLSDWKVDYETSLMFNLQVLSDGRYVISDGKQLSVHDQEGKRCFTISDLDRTIGNSVISANGKYYVTSGTYDFAKKSDIQIKEVNMQTGELGKSYEAGYLDTFGNIIEAEGGLFVNSSYGCYQVDIEKGELSQVFDWNDADVEQKYRSHSKCLPVSGEELYVLGSDSVYDEFDERYIIHLTKAEKNPHAGKKIIVIGGSNMEYNDSFMSFLYEYNHDPNNQCRAILHDYSDDLAYSGDYAELERKVYLSILSGEGPDILLNFGDSSAFQTEDVMVEMNQYLDGENGISRDDYFDNILRSQEKNGKLYHIPIRFILSGIEVNTDLIPNKIGWTFDEFDEAGSSIPENVSFFEGMNYDAILMLLLEASLPEFLDYSNKTVNFENDKMKRILQMAKKYGMKELPKDEGYETEYINDNSFSIIGNYTEEKFYAGLLAARSYQVSNLEMYALEQKNMKGHAGFLGFPSSDRNGMGVYVMLSVGIVSTSKYRELAWDLISSFLRYTPEENGEFSLSVNRASFERESREEIRENNERYDKNASTADPTFMKYFTRLTEEDMNEVQELIESTTCGTCYDSAILAVISEEAAGYFAGDRTEDEVLKNIQNRTATILKEM